MNLLYENNNIFGGWLNDWRTLRVRKLEEIFGRNWFRGKKLLEVGAGFGNLGLYFKSLGADVTMTDIRNECLERIKEKDPQAKTFSIDHDKEWSLPDKFDIVLHFGLSYNLENWERDLSCTIKQSCKYIVFETAVNKFKDDISFLIKDYHYHHPYLGPAHAVGSLPSISLIQKELDKHNVTYERYDKAELNIYNFIYTNACDYDFVYPTAKGPYIIDGWDSPHVRGGRKFWIIKKGEI